MTESKKRFWLYHLSPAKRGYFIFGRRKVPTTAENLLVMLETEGPVAGAWTIAANAQVVRVGEPVIVLINSGSKERIAGLVGFGKIHKVDRDEKRIWIKFDLSRTRALMKKPVPLAEFRRVIPKLQSNIVDVSRYHRQIGRWLVSHTGRPITRRKARSAELPLLVDTDVRLSPEAARKFRNQLAVERRTENRRKILAKHATPYVCEACGMDFASTYGPEFGTLIYVHHKTPVDSAKKGYSPKSGDFALLCPNCHAVAHYKDPLKPISPAAIKTLTQTDSKS